MADIAFLLIIFFMVTTVFQVDRTSVLLPISTVRDEIPRGAAFVVLTEDRALKFSNGADESVLVMEMNEIYFVALQLIDSDPLFPFVIKADANVKYSDIDEALDALRRAKVQKVILLTNQETVS